jgi:hypothetical protein
VKHIKEYKE